MVRIHPDPPISGQQVSAQLSAESRTLRADRRTGAVAQLGEHLLCKQGVVGSNPISSTSSIPAKMRDECGERVCASPQSSLICE
jgi:hypothetical protein